MGLYIYKPHANDKTTIKDLVCKSHIGSISKLIQIGNAGEIDHGRRAAHQNQVVI